MLDSKLEKTDGGYRFPESSEAGGIALMLSELVYLFIFGESGLSEYERDLIRNRVPRTR